VPEEDLQQKGEVVRNEDCRLSDRLRPETVQPSEEMRQEMLWAHQAEVQDEEQMR